MNVVVNGKTELSGHNQGVPMKEGWQIKHLGEVSEVFDGPHATPKTVDSGPIFLGIGALQDGVINLEETRHVTPEDFTQWTRRVLPQPGDVVFSYETRLGQAAIIPDGLQCCLGRRMGLVRFKKEIVDPHFFLFQYLSPQYREFLDSKTIRGATVDRISIKEFPSFPIVVPPLPEQQRIVALLDEAFEGLATAKANAEQNLRNARALFASHLESVFSERGVEWAEMTLDQVVTSDCSLSYGIVQPGDEVNGGLPVVRPTDLTQDEIFLDGLKRIDPDRASSYRRTTLQGGELLLCVRGSTGVLSKAAQELAGANVTRGIVPLRLNTNLLTAGFSFHLLRSELVQEQIRSKTYGTALMQINIGDLRKISIAFPPVEKQHSITTELDSIAAETQHLTHLYERKLTALEELKKALLHLAFHGEL